MSATKGSENTTQRLCISHKGLTEGKHKANVCLSRRDAKVAGKNQGKGGVAATKRQQKHMTKAVHSAYKRIGRKRQRKHKATAVP